MSSATQHIKLPDLWEANRLKKLFLNLGNIPNVIGGIDGTLDRLKAPQNEHEFVNRCGTHSITVQVVCDAELRMPNAVVYGVSTRFAFLSRLLCSHAMLAVSLTG